MWPRPTIVLVLVALLGASWPTRADVIVPSLPERREATDREREAARRAYTAVQESYARGELSRALDAAEVAFAAVPNASTALIRATLMGQLGRPAAAFAVFLVAADLSPTADEMAQITAGLEANGKDADPQLGWVRLWTGDVRASVTLGGLPIPAGRALGVTVAAYDIEVAAEGFETQQRPVVVRPGEGQEVKVELRRAGSSDAAVAGGRPGDGRGGEPGGDPGGDPGEEPVAEPSGDPTGASVAESGQVGPIDVSAQATDGDGGDGGVGMDALAWSLVGVGAAVAATGGGIHAWAFDASDEANRYIDPRSDMTEAERKKRYNAAKGDADARQYGAIALYALGGASLFTGVVLFFVAGDAEESPPAATPVVTPALIDGGAALLLSGRF